MIIEINTENSFNFNLVENAAFCFLEKHYKESLKNDDWKMFNDNKFVYMPVVILDKFLNITAYQQRKILNKFQKMGLVDIVYSQARARYYRVVEVETRAKKEDLINTIRKMSKNEIDNLMEQLNREI